MDNKSIFEKIIDREIESQILYENKDFIIILDAFPKSEGHSLIIPKSKENNLLEEDEETVMKLFKLTHIYSNQLREILNCDGVRIQSNIGKTSGQEVFHTHIHVIPSYKEERDSANPEDLKDLITKKINI